jgi:hypothetical protein
MLAACLLAGAAALPPIQEPAQEVLRGDPEPDFVAGAWQVLGPFSAQGASAGGAELDLAALRLAEPWPELTRRFTGAGGLLLAWTTLDVERTLREGEAGLIHPRERVGLESGRLEPRLLVPATAAEEVGDALSIYLYRAVHTRAAVTVLLQIQAAGPLRLWCNGEQVADLGSPVARRELKLSLRKGLNHLLLESSTAGGPWWLEMQQAHPLTQPRIDRAIRSGQQYLMERQLPDGSWQDYADYVGGSTALAVYTLLKSGVAADHRSVSKGLAYLRTHPARHTYAMALVLLAVGAAGQSGDESWMAEMTDELLTWQERGGLWGYPFGGDLSNTQYAALGLWAAEKRGIVVPQDVWSDLAQAVLSCSDKSLGDGFGYTPGSPPTASMTAAGVGTLAICRDHLDDRSAQLVRRTERAIAAGAEWLGKNCMLHPLGGGADMWSLYMLYGLERAGALARLERFGGHPWYPEGAGWILEQQQPTGGWSAGEVDVNTSFAVLFLARATARQAVTQGESENGAGRLFSSPPDDGPLRLRLALGNPANLWIDAGTPEFQRIARVVYALRAPDGKWRTLLGGASKRFDAQVVFDVPGAWQVRATAFRHDGSSFGSGTIDIEQAEGMEAASADAETEAGEENLLQVAEVKARASSGDASAACDSRYATRWMCAADDGQPWLELEFGRRVKASRIALCAASWNPEDPPLRAVPTRVLVRVNGGEARLMEIPSGLPGRVFLDLEEPTMLSRLRIEIQGVRGGRLGAAAVGFSEIEAYASSR